MVSTETHLRIRGYSIKVRGSCKPAGNRSLELLAVPTLHFSAGWYSWVPRAWELGSRKRWGMYAHYTVFSSNPWFVSPVLQRIISYWNEGDFYKQLYFPGVQSAEYFLCKFFPSVEWELSCWAFEAGTVKWDSHAEVTFGSLLHLV